jgi:hypothetical protein
MKDLCDSAESVIMEQHWIIVKVLSKLLLLHSCFLFISLCCALFIRVYVENDCHVRRLYKTCGNEFQNAAAITITWV